MKLFCLGLHKTGTSSLKIALENEGFRVADFFGVKDPDIGRTGLQDALAMVPEYDAFQDDPWHIYYREFHRKVPDARFVLLTRDSGKWYNSCLRHFGGKTNEVRKLVYGADKSDPTGNREHWICCKEEHERKVREYFSAYPDIFLEMDVTQGDGWDKLGPFIGHKPRSTRFPKANSVFQRKHHALWLKFDQSKGLKRLYYRSLMRILRELDKRS